MSLWAGLTLNTSELANVVNRVHNRKAIPMVVKANPMLYGIFGKRDGVNNKNLRIGKTRNITGKDVEVRLLGRLAAPTAISDGSDELTTATVNYSSDNVASVTVALAHYGHVEGVPDSEYMRFRGSDSKTEDWVDEVYSKIMYGYEDVLSTALHSTTAPSRAAFGAWQVAVDSSTAYMGMTRSDSANADFRGLEYDAKVITIKEIQTRKNEARTNLGNPSVGVAGNTLFTHIQTLNQGYTHVIGSGDTSNFGWDHCVVSGIEWMLDPDTSDGILGAFDPQWWELIKNDEPFTGGGLIEAPWLKSGRIIHTTLWIQNFCTKPNAQIKWTAATTS
jgi:hypothetical protein